MYRPVEHVAVCYPIYQKCSHQFSFNSEEIIKKNCLIFESIKNAKTRGPCLHNRDVDSKKSKH